MKNIIKDIGRRLLQIDLIMKIYKIYYKVSNLRIVQGPLTYAYNGLYTMHNSDFMKNQKFLEAYRIGKQPVAVEWGNKDIHWRIHVLCWAARHASNLEGDFVECGVYKGFFSRAVMHYIDFGNLNKKFYLLDTFCGLSEKYILEEERLHGIKSGTFDECYNQVKEIFKDFNVEIIRGTIPETLSKVNAKKVCYLSIDMNCAEPEIAAAEYFWDKLVSGAIIILDDYGFKKHIVQKKAFDEFAEKKNIEILQLPTGQGLIVKP